MDTQKIQEMQEEHDKKYWEHNDSKLEKIRHITLHMGKLIGKLSSYCEQQEHGINYSEEQINNEVIPDLIVYSAQLSNLNNINLGDSYLKRLNEVKKKIEKLK